MNTTPPREPIQADTYRNYRRTRRIRGALIVLALCLLAVVSGVATYHFAQPHQAQASPATAVKPPATAFARTCWEVSLNEEVIAQVTYHQRDLPCGYNLVAPGITLYPSSAPSPSMQASPLLVEQCVGYEGTTVYVIYSWEYSGETSAPADAQNFCAEWAPGHF